MGEALGLQLIYVGDFYAVFGSVSEGFDDSLLYGAEDYGDVPDSGVFQVLQSVGEHGFVGDGGHVLVAGESEMPQPCPVATGKEKR